MNINYEEKTISQSPSLARGDRLDSWKEIAAYLDREVRTVQRWEKREGLPVHRHFHVGGGTTYAFKTEIDGWLIARGQILSEFRGMPKRPRYGLNPPPKVTGQMVQALILWLATFTKNHFKARTERLAWTLGYAACSHLYPRCSRELAAVPHGHMPTQQDASRPLTLCRGSRD